MKEEQFIKTDESGTLYYSDEAMTVLHREDGPAIERSTGANEWYIDGKRHREDGPAAEYFDGFKMWYIDGKRHREDGPAYVYADGAKEWYINGQLHREDGPAAEYADGAKLWYIDGKLHREDGPAVERATGDKLWCINGKELTEEEFNDRDRVEVTLDEIAEKLGMKEQRKVAARLDDEAYDASQFIHKLGEVQEQEFDKLWERVESKGWMKGFDDSDDARGFLWDYCFNRSIYTDKGESVQSFSEAVDAEWMSSAEQ